MTMRRFAAAFFFIALLPASAQESAASDPVASLFLGQFSSEQAARIAPGVVAYSKAARAWWIEDHCHLAAAMHEESFPADLAGLTGAMKGLFVSQLGATPEQAAKQVQQIQVFALEQMTSAKFYDCGDQAKATLKEGYDVTQHIANAARERAAQPPQ